MAAAKDSLAPSRAISLMRMRGGVSPPLQHQRSLDVLRSLGVLLARPEDQRGDLLAHFGFGQLPGLGSVQTRQGDNGLVCGGRQSKA